MAINIDTTSTQYQQYMNGLASLRTFMLPRFKVFHKLSLEKQKWWLARDPLMRRVLKMGLIINKLTNPNGFETEVEDD